MEKAIQRSPQEITARTDYREAFLGVMASRGLNPASVVSIEQAGCILSIEAGVDDEDGAIQLPDGLATEIFRPYQGIRSPAGEQPVLVTDVSFGPDSGAIKIEPKLLHYTQAPQVDGFVTVVEAGRAVSSTVYFDLNKGKYFVEVLKIDSNGRIINETGPDTPETFEEHDLTVDMVNDLTSVLPLLNRRENSRISIYKTPLQIE